MNFSQKTGQFLIGRGNGSTSVEDKQNERRLFDRNLGLFEDSLGDFALFTRNNSPRIYNLEGAAIPGRRTINAIARNARLISDDGSTLANQTIEQRGFPYVRAADDCDE